MRKYYWLLLLCCSFLCFGQNKKYSSNALSPAREPNGYIGYKIKGLNPAPEACNFLVVGDWGRNGQFRQQDVADRMGEAAYQLDAQFVVSTGDNFYINGIASTEDPAWNSSFENIYTNHALMCNWYPVLGNHDYRGNVQAQIDYSKKSRRWNMPSRYYAIERLVSSKSTTKVLFVFLDTSPFDSGLYDGRYGDVAQQDTTAQLRWIDTTLANSKADWKIVVGHHPIYTSGKRLGKTQELINIFDPIFEKHKVDVYFAGHEHDLQHQKPKNRYTHHIVSGAGSEIRETGKMDMTLFSISSHGFIAASLYNDKLLLQMIDEKGQILYKYELVKQK